MNVKRDLQNAATLLRERGWCQGDYEDASGGLCVWGALCWASGADPDGPECVPAGNAARAVAAQIGLRDAYDDLANWNDFPSRTAEEVIAALEAAAEAAPDA